MLIPLTPVVVAFVSAAAAGAPISDGVVARLPGTRIIATCRTVAAAGMM